MKDLPITTIRKIVMLDQRQPGHDEENAKANPIP
jgi:hypothetical protein